MAGRSARKGIPKLSHEAVREHLVDYHFGRLAPGLNAAVELHVRSCATCQREGLNHLATQKREAVRLTRRLRRRRVGMAPVIRLLTLVLVLVLLILLIRVSTSRGQRLPWLGASYPGTGTSTPTANTTPAPSPTVATLVSAGTFGQASNGAVAVSGSADGKAVAFVTVVNGAVRVSTWDAKSRAQQVTMAYSASAVPGVLAWSPDKTHLAAATGQNVMIWNSADGTRLWSVLLPQGAAVRVYDAQSGAVVQRPDPATTFTQGAFLQWGQNGQVSSAPATAAGATAVATPDGPLVGLWQVNGSHIFAGADSHPYVGVSPADSAAHVALLSWSPDGRYLLWGSLSQPVQLSAPAATGWPTATAGVAAPAGAVPAPDPAAEAIAEHVAARQGDALLWFSPDGRWVAVCDRTAHVAPLVVMTRDQGRAVNQVAGVCQNLTASAVSWNPDSSGFILGLPSQPADSYMLPTHG